MFTLVAPAGTIIDVSLSFVLNDVATAGLTYTVASGTLGVLYYAPLDDQGDIYLPVSRLTTT